MSSTAIIFAKELTRWEDFPGDVPPESKSVWNALSHATQEELKADLAKQGFFSGTSFSFIGIYFFRTVIIILSNKEHFGNYREIVFKNHAVDDRIPHFSK